jgi:hypothetical protein
LDSYWRISVSLFFKITGNQLPLNPHIALVH